MNAALSLVLAATVFERLGGMNEQLYELEAFSADIEDSELAAAIIELRAVNHRALRRANDLLQLEKATGPLDEDLAVSTSSGPEGDRS